MTRLPKYALMAQRKEGFDWPRKPLVMYVGDDKARLEADAKRRESPRVHYWVVDYAEQFPNARG